MLTRDSKLIIFGSSSAGNMYRFEDILLESGIKPTPGALEGARFCLISHSHGDHCKYWDKVALWGIPIFGPFSADHGWMALNANEIIQCSGWDIMPFRVKHDVENFGYFCRRDDIRLAYITDTARILPSLKGVTHLVVECNHSQIDLLGRLERGEKSAAEIRRVFQNHMSIETLADYISGMDKSRLQEIVLIHISARHGDGEVYAAKIKDIAGVPVYFTGRRL